MLLGAVEDGQSAYGEKERQGRGFTQVEVGEVPGV
jgi:ribosomal protein L13E